MAKPSPEKLNPAWEAAVKRKLATPPRPMKAVRKKTAKGAATRLKPPGLKPRGSSIVGHGIEGVLYDGGNDAPNHLSTIFEFK